MRTTSKKQSRRPASSTFTHKTVITGSAEETRVAGALLARQFVPGDVIFLAGDLGSGKTTLMQGIARGLGVKDLVRSSSFMLVNEYAGTAGPVYHMDLYRLASVETRSAGLDEYTQSGGICIIEWADRMPRELAQPTWEIALSWIDDTTRRLVVQRQRGSRAERRRIHP